MSDLYAIDAPEDARTQARRRLQQQRCLVCGARQLSGSSYFCTLHIRAYRFCSICETLRATADHGKDSRCKACAAGKALAYYHANADATIYRIRLRQIATRTATLDEGDSPGEVEQLLWNQAKAAVHAQIDLALEANDRPAKHSTDPRYQVMATYSDSYLRKDMPKLPQLIVLLPDSFDHREHYDKVLVHAVYPESRNMRYDHAMRVAFKAARERDADLIDCARGDLARLDAALAVPVSNPDVASTEDSPF